MMPSNMARRTIAAQQGFTLLELMIAIVLTGMVVLISAGTMRLGTRAAESEQIKIEAIERFRTSLNIIESQIQSAFIIRNSGLTADLDFYQFKGDGKSLQFRSLYSLWGNTKGPVLVTYEIKEDNRGGKILSVTESPVVIPDVTREVKLIDGSKDIFFEYFYKGPTDEKGRWVDEWTEKQSIPERIRITINKDSKVLALIIPLKIAVKTKHFSHAGTLGR
jgi:prepilin-type N-terminal cleavage/methylation domain-containing protein